MKPDWNRRFAAVLLAILLCLCSFSMPAFASGSDPAPEPLPEILDEKTTTGGMEPEGVPITPKGNATLVDDFYGDKQLITVTTKAGNYFYILIDRANEDKETSVHFLNQVDDADLLALLDEEPQDTEFCTCTVKCEAGNVNENCPLCEKSLRNCTAPEAVKTDTETPEEKPKSNMGSLIVLLVLALAGGGAALYYFKFRKPKADTTGHDDLDEYDFGEDEPMKSKTAIGRAAGIWSAGASGIWCPLPRRASTMKNTVSGGMRICPSCPSRGSSLSRTRRNSSLKFCVPCSTAPMWIV